MGANRTALFVVSLAAMVPATASAYTVKHTSGGAVVHWSVDRVELHVDRSVTELVSASEAERAVTIAAEAWRGLGGPDLVVAPDLTDTPYRPGAPGTDVRVLEPWPYDARLLAVTVTSYDDVTGRIVDADIMLNPRNRFAMMDEANPDEGAFDLASVLTHEAGHVLGLDESEDDPAATMWPHTRRGDTQQRTVEQDDELGVAAAYASVDLAASSVGCGGASVAGRGTPTGWAWLAVAAGLGLIARRSRRRA